MVAFVKGMYNDHLNPGSPAPISFGPQNDPSQDMSLTPGSGSGQTVLGGFGPIGGSAGGGSASGGGGGTASGGRVPGAPGAQTLSTVQVNGGGLQGQAPMFGTQYGQSSTPPSNTAGGLHVTDLAPVNVKPQMPVQPNWFSQYEMWGNDHPWLQHMAEAAVSGAIPLMKPVFVGAHAYFNAAHGHPLFGTFLNSAQHLVNRDQSTPASQSAPNPLAASVENPLYGNLYNGPAASDGPGSPGGASQSFNAGAAGSITGLLSGGPLPAYPGLGSFSGGSAPIGGFWNQQALRSASPAYGPYAGYGNTPAPAPATPQGFAPFGISSLGG